ncbi:hypothetical protein [uncultured Corynebacterium sp.]|uniref:hypothetical protein n=1 Tax=uncultured Corynebacterium sp. TaxID=159447 RepID=UPI0025E9C8A7|nr:hypothetical protein [uncultured Corynebacterium sp.]
MTNIRGRRRFTTPTPTTIGLLVASMLLAGCGAVGAKDAGTSDETSDAEQSLPPGVLPPNDPPQPGDARLGSDGHYDYSAPDFVLKNPCDMDAYQVALRQGWSSPETGEQHRDFGDFQFCAITRRMEAVGVFSHSLTRDEFESTSLDFEVHTDAQSTWYTAVRPGLVGESCFVVVDTPSGGAGITAGVGGFSEHKTRETACEYATTLFKEFFGGK